MFNMREKLEPLEGIYLLSCRHFYRAVHIYSFRLNYRARLGVKKCCIPIILLMGTDTYLVYVLGIRTWYTKLWSTCHISMGFLSDTGTQKRKQTNNNTVKGCDYLQFVFNPLLNPLLKPLLKDVYGDLFSPNAIGDVIWQKLADGLSENLN